MIYADFSKNISRWLFLSVGQHFSEAVETPAFKMFIQGQQRSAEDAKLQHFCELRTDGPYLRPKSKGLYEIEYQVNTLIQTTDREQSFVGPYVDVGKVLPAFVSIPVFRYGDGNLDDESFIGCLKISKQGRTDEIRVDQFGIIEPALGIIQATIEAHYKLEILLKAI